MEDWKARVHALRGEGLSVRQIAERVGKSKSLVGELLKPHHCDCGNVRSHSHTRCRECYDRDITAGHAELGRLWEQGLTVAEIATALGMTPGAVAVKVNRLRYLYGREDLVPFRRTPEQVERIREGRWGTAA